MITNINMCPDTSDYPGNHDFFCFALDEEVSSRVSDVMQTVPDLGSRPIEDILRKLLTSFAKHPVTNGKHSQTTDESDEDEDEDTDAFDEQHYDSDEDDLPGIHEARSQSDIKMAFLLRYAAQAELCSHCADELNSATSMRL